MTAYYNEIEPYCAEWLRNLIKAGHIAPGDVDDRDIKEVSAADLKAYTQCHFFTGVGIWSYSLRQAGWPDDRPVWSGSAPCQPFSAAGKKKGTADKRHLWPDFFRLIRECRPDVVFGEQVSSKDGLAWFDAVSADCEGAGYAIGALDSCAAWVGAPQLRHRLYFVAESKGERRRKEREDAGRGGGGGGEERLEQRSEHGGVGVVACTEGDQRRPEQQAGGARGGWSRSARSGVLGNNNNTGPQVGPLADDGQRALRIEGPAAGEAGVVSGFWRDADLIWCRDGKYRPVGSGTFPLAPSNPGRVGKLRAYGNSLVAAHAAEFVKSYIEVTRG